MFSELDVLRDVARRLDAAKAMYMLTGSLALSYYAIPRMTRDIDIVIALSASNIQDLVAAFEGDYYLSVDAIEDAIRHESKFNVIHFESVIKVDLIVRKSTEYRIEEFRRRQRISIDDFSLWIVSREDLILSKLFWFSETGWQIQQRDILNLLSGQVDLAYLRRWAGHLGLTPLLDSIINE